MKSLTSQLQLESSRDDKHNLAPYYLNYQPQYYSSIVVKTNASSALPRRPELFWSDSHSSANSLMLSERARELTPQQIVATIVGTFGRRVEKVGLELGGIDSVTSVATFRHGPMTCLGGRPLHCDKRAEAVQLVYAVLSNVVQPRDNDLQFYRLPDHDQPSRNRILGLAVSIPGHFP